MSGSHDLTISSKAILIPSGKALWSPVRFSSLKFLSNFFAHKLVKCSLAPPKMDLFTSNCVPLT